MSQYKVGKEERDSLFENYIKLVSSQRNQWRSLQKQRGNREDVEESVEYRQSLEADLSRHYAGILTVLDERLIPSCLSGESTVFYYTKKGDYYKYLAEFKSGGEKYEAAYQSQVA